MGVTLDALADAQDHRAVARDQGGEGELGILAAGGEAVQEGAVGLRAEHADPEQGLELPRSPPEILPGMIPCPRFGSFCVERRRGVVSGRGGLDTRFRGIRANFFRESTWRAAAPNVSNPEKMQGEFLEQRTTLGAGASDLIGMLVRFGRFVDFAIRATLAVPGAIVRRPGAVLKQFERVSWGSLALAVVAGVSVGLVTWMQTRRLLVLYGVEASLPSVLAAAVFVETGPMLAALLVAGRMGAGLAAELASMDLTEELDAREILGSPTIPSLVAPAAACVVALPLLTICMDLSALLGGLLAELVAGDLSAQLYFTRSLDYLRLVDIVPATLKTAVLGLLIGLVGCWTGLNSGRTTESVGRAATRGVVGSMLAVFAANVLLVKGINSVVEMMGWTV